MTTDVRPRRGASTVIARLGCAVGAALLLTGAADAAEITLANAWMRPIREGLPTAMAYVDIKSDADVRLVGASTPAAKSVAIIDVTQNPDDTTTSKEVKALEVPGGKVTRLAYNGSHLELREVLETRGTGQTVALKLEFVDAAGKRQFVETVALMRGILLWQPPEDRAQPK